ncbi:hypothetical protein K466DRAFT_583627 [Polyporus arcularius HHB13444]|uniref:F-box domain-containing protein n=1 Tax=Polyporus arcularius HHB13444 TaxID=1314778 RepID=A0A5C3PNN8_9APHY|nr:hypothetical protein K466DRAFT_583627 [Polyporus arcularius HHB13444]
MYARYAHHRTPRDARTTLDRLPAEILLEVTSYLTSRSYILHLSQVSSCVHAKVVPALYADVELHGAEQCERTLHMLQRRPDVARHIRRLSVHPEDEGSSRPHEQIKAWDNAGVVSRCVMKVAQHLDALSHFEWDGEDMLPDDRMWSELRARCPRLRHVGTTFGCFLPRPTSSLFKFTELLGFSLSFKDGFYAHSLHLPSRESEPVFTRLWDMLTLRCPHLESLRIVGNSSEPSDASRLYTADWPQLRYLTLGALVWTTTVPGQAHTTSDFKTFLERHPTIESLHLLGRPSTNQVDLSTLPPEALPNLKEFSGSFSLLRSLVDRVQPEDPAAAGVNVAQAQPQVQVQNLNQNQQLPPVPTTPLSKTLQRVCFPHPMHLRDLTPLAISRVLLGLQALTSIKVTFAIQGGYDSNGVFRTLVASCPHLSDMDITCTNRPSFFLDAFATSLRGLSRLRTLSLALVRMPGEEPMHVGASRIALANPRLKSFSIAFIPAQGTSELPLPPVEQGTFDLTCDAHGIPVCLDVSQRYAAVWPWKSRAGARAGVAEWFASVASALGVEAPLILLENSVGTSGVRYGLGDPALWRALAFYRGWSTSRRWRYDLRPSGHPDLEKKGLFELLTERNPAGEEARLMMFCMCLLLLPVWALISKAARGA